MKEVPYLERLASSSFWLSFRGGGICFCWALTVTAGLLASQVKWIFVLASVLLSWTTVLYVCVFLAPEDDQLEDEAWIFFSWTPIMLGGRIAGLLANHSDFRSRSRSCAWYKSLDLLSDALAINWVVSKWFSTLKCVKDVQKLVNC